MSAAPLTLYGLKNCDTCRKAIAALTAGDHEVAFVDIREEADLPRLVPVWLKALGAETLVNKRSTTWRALSEAEKKKALSGDAAKILIANPTLIKRPVIDAGADIYVGWTKGMEQSLQAS